jgi:hypothetical protein
MKTKNVIKALGIVGLAAGVMLAAGDTFAAEKIEFSTQANFQTTADNIIDLIVNYYETPLGKIILIGGSVIAVVSYLLTQKLWTLVIAACIIASPAFLGGIENLVEGSSGAIVSAN